MRAVEQSTVAGRRMVTMKHTIGLALILSTLAAACGPTFTSGSVGIGDGAVLDDDTANTGAEDAQATDAGRSDADANADSGVDTADAQKPHDGGQEVDVAEDAVEQPETDPWPPDGAVLGDPDVQDASADSGPQDTGSVADAGRDASVTTDAARDAGDGGGAEGCSQLGNCGECLARPGCVWCRISSFSAEGACAPMELPGIPCGYRYSPEHSHLCR